MPENTGSQRLFDLFEQLRTVRAGPHHTYNTDDVIAILYLLARNYTVSEIHRRTRIGRETIKRWRDAFQDGQIEQLYPDIRDRMAVFDITVLPSARVRRERPMLAWQQSIPRLEDRPNPYLPQHNGSNNVEE